jgi:hypothetical protein
MIFLENPDVQQIFVVVLSGLRDWSDSLYAMLEYTPEYVPHNISHFIP